jgi:CopG family transcriptional regulator/antitoxin EndoAI
MKRINVILPDSTLALLDRVAPKRNRSRFVADAVLHYVESCGKQSLRERMKSGYLAEAGENLKIAADWFPLEQEVPQSGDARRKHAPRK